MVSTEPAGTGLREISRATAPAMPETLGIHLGAAEGKAPVRQRPAYGGRPRHGARRAGPASGGGSYH